eukprot:3717973-Pyramimonas_sp.AAC.1
MHSGVLVDLTPGAATGAGAEEGAGPQREPRRLRQAALPLQLRQGGAAHGRLSTGAVTAC